MVRLDTSQPGMGLMSTSGITQRHSAHLKLYICENFVMMIPNISQKRDWDIETEVEPRAENQFLMACQCQAGVV